MTPCAESTRWCCRVHGNGLGRSAYACVPHANGFRGLLHVPGGVASAFAFPFVRAVARTCTWAVRPCCRRLSLLPLSGGALLTASQGSGIVAATASRYPRRKDDRDAPRKGAGWPINSPGRRTKQELFLLIIRKNAQVLSDAFHCALFPKAREGRAKRCAPSGEDRLPESSPRASIRQDRSSSHDGIPHAGNPRRRRRGDGRP